MAKKSSSIDITKLGPQGYRQLQEANNAAYAKNDPDMAEFMKGYAPLGHNMDPYQNAPHEINIPSPNGIPYGNSKYDTPSTTISGLEHLQDIRAENQPWYDALGNSIVKMLGTAATTLINGFVNIPVGIATAIGEGRFSGLWDNELTQALSDVDNWFEDNFKIYQTEEQEAAPWLSWTNLTSASFWGDDVIKNIGFMLGAAVPGGAFTKGLGLVAKGLGIASEATNASRATTALLGSIFSAAGEGAIEARQNYESIVELNSQRLNDELGKLALQYQQEYEATKGTLEKGADGAYHDPAYEKYKERMNELSKRRKLGMQQIIQDARSAGNWTMAFNMPILTLSNFITLGKAYTKSYFNARNTIETANRSEASGLIRGIDKSKLGTAFNEAAKGNTVEGVESTLKNVKLRKAWAFAKPIISEGSEEMNQQWASSFAGFYKNREDVNDYWKARMDPGSEQDTLSFLTAVGKGFFDSWGNFDQWEQFFVGGLMGGVGMAMPTKNGKSEEDKNRKWYNPRKWFTWEGGSFQNLRELNKMIDEATKNSEVLNKMYKDPEFWNKFRDGVANRYAQADMDQALEDDDIKAYKDSWEKQFAQALSAHVRAGKVDDFRALIEAATHNLSNEDIDNLIKRNSITISKEQDQERKRRILTEEMERLQSEKDAIGDESTRVGYVTNPDRLEEIDRQIGKLQEEYDNYVGEEHTIGAYVDSHGNVLQSHDEIREDLEKTGESINRRVDEYLQSIDVINHMSHGRLTSDQEGNLAYLHYMGKAARRRAEKIISEYTIPNTFIIKPVKGETPEIVQKSLGLPDGSVSKNDDGTLTIDISSVSNDKKYPRRREGIYLETALGHDYDSAVQNSINLSGGDPNLIKDLADATSLILDSREYVRVFDEYMKDPSKADEAKSKAEREAEKEINNSNIDGKSVSEIVEGAENGDINIRSDEFDFTDEEMDILNGKTPDAAITPEIERKQKVNTAREIIDTKNQAKAKARALDIDDATMSDLEAMIDRASSSAESANDVLDTETEAFNDPDSLSTTTEEQELLGVINNPDSSLEDIEAARQLYQESRQQRLDEIKNIVQQIKEGVADDLEELKRMPKSGPNAPKSLGTMEDNDSKDPTEATPTTNKKSDSREVIEDDIPTPSTQTLNLEEQSNSQPKQMPEKGYWKGNTTEYPIHRDKTNNKPFYEQIDDKTRQAISKAIYTFLKETGAYERIKNNEIKPGQKVRFAISKKLTNSINSATGQGVPVILVVDENGNVLCDLPCPACVTIFNKYPGLKEFYDEAVKYTNEHFNDNANDLIIIPNFESSISRPYIGRPLYSANNVRHTLNEIADGKPFKLGIALTSSPNPTMVMTPGRRRSQGLSKEDLTIVRPESGVAGQPYLLIETSDPNRKWLTVPITMPTFSATGGARLTRMVVEHLLQLSNPQDLLTEEQQIAWKNKLRDLLSIGDIYLDIKKNPNNNGYTVNFRIKRLKSDTAWTTVFNGEVRAGDLLIQRVESLNIPYQVSRKYINSQFNGQDYNSLIGELASTNLEIGALHTVNDFFTINPIVNGKQQKAKPIQDAPRDAENKAKATRENTFVTGNIVPDQANVDRNRTDGNYYYIKESDGKYHKYQRVHNVLPVNSNKKNSNQRALRTGSAIDTIVRDFFNTGKTTKPDFMSDEAYNSILKYLNTLNKWLKDHNWTVYANNIVLYNKYPDGRRIAGEVDLLLVDDKGNYHIYDVKTSAGSFTGDYFEGVHTNWGQVMSTKDYYTLQVSSYAKLLNDRFGKKTTSVAIVPFNIVYGENDNVIGVTKVPNISLPIVDVSNNFKNATLESSKVSKAVPSKDKKETKKILDELLDQVNPLPAKDSKSYSSDYNTTSRIRELIKNPKKSPDTIRDSKGNPIDIEWCINKIRENLKRIEDTKRERDKRARETQGMLSQDESLRGPEAMLGVLRKQNKEYLTYAYWLLSHDNSVTSDSNQHAQQSSTKASQSDNITELNKNEPESLDERITINSSLDGNGSTDVFGKKGSKVWMKQKDGRTPGRKNSGNVVFYETDGMQQIALEVPHSARAGAINVTIWRLLTEREKNAISTLLLDNYMNHTINVGFSEIASLIDNILHNKPAEILIATESKPDTSEPKTSVDTARENLGNNKLFKSQKWQNRLSRLNDENILGLNEMAKRTPILKRTLDHLDAKIKANMSDEELNNLVAEQLKPKNREVERTTQEQSSIDKEVEVIEKLLPQLSQEDRIRIVDSLIKIPNGRAWGQFKDGAITLYRNAARGTAYHEAFHFVFNTLMTDQEIERAYGVAEKQWGNLSPLELEERMAEDFRRYMQNQETFIGRLKNLWSRLKALINHFNSNWNYLDRVYADISRGNYSNREVIESQEVRNRPLPTMEFMQNTVDDFVNRIRPTRYDKNVAWGSLRDTWRRMGYDIRGYYDPKYRGYKVASIRPLYDTEEIRQYHESKLAYRNLDQESKDYLNERHITPQEYENMTLKEKEVLFRCMY